MSSELKNNLKDLRAARNLTQADLAVLVQVSRKTINTIENSVFVPSTVLSLRIAKVLSAGVEDIFYLEGEDDIST